MNFWETDTSKYIPEVRMFSLIISKWSKGYWLIITKVWYKRFFHRIGEKSVIIKPMQFSDTSSVSIGNKTTIFHYSWLMGSKDTNQKTMLIGDRVQIGHFSHIVAKKKVVIENDVLIADRVFITDCTHNFSDAKIPILYQGVSVIGDVQIGEGTWIGENVCIIGAKVGKHCVIGSNSVVNRNIPDYSIAAGAPAKVIRKTSNDLGVKSNC